MFAQSGGGGGDDPYNFDIADGFGGGASKRNSKKSKLGKSFLRKTADASAGDSSLKRQDSSTATAKIAAAVDLKEPLRASAPAAPASALDKAMSFLNKYCSNPASNKMGTERTFGKSSDAPNSTFNEDELDLSLSSDSDAGDWKPARKASTDWKASRDQVTPEPQQDGKSRALTEMRTSARFSTAKDLGISGPGELGMPKAAVSPVGLIQISANRESEGAQPYQADGYSPPENRLSGLRLAVNIPGDSSPHTSLIRPGSDSDVDCISSPLGEGVEDKTRVRAEGFQDRSKPGSCVSEIAGSTEISPVRNSSFASPTFQQHSESARTSRQDGTGASDRGFARHAVDHGSLGNIVSFDNLAAVSGREIFSNANDGRAVATEVPLGGKESNIENNGSHTAEDVAGEEEEDDDDYGEDDFEDQDVLMESNSEAPDGEQASGKTTLGRGSDETAGSSCFHEVVSQRSVPVPRGSPAPVEASPEDRKQREAEESAADSRAGRQEMSTGAVHRIGESETPAEPREAWSVTAANEEKARLGPIAIDSGTSPESRMNADAEWKDSVSPGNSPSIHGRAPSAVKEAWGHASASSPSGNGRRDCCAAQTLRSNSARCPNQGGDAACGTGSREASIGSVSRRGILMDRSTEAKNRTRSPGAKVTVVVRTEAVSSVEYAHDPERELDLRSCGTQMIGNSAAVQANIVVPGMAGTTSHIDGAFVRRGTRTAGVGYGQGEAYAKWGRFACEVPQYLRGGVSAGDSSLNQPRRRPRPEVDAGRDDHAGRENDGAIGGGGSVADDAESTGKREDTGAAKLHETVGEANAAKMGYFHPGQIGPAYFETFSNLMAKSRDEDCFPLQQMPGEAPPPGRVSAPSGDCDHPEGEAEMTGVAEDENPGVRDTARRVQMYGCCGGASEVNVALHDIMVATQDSFRTQLADMRESLNKIRYRAEMAGRHGHVHQYESLTDARDFLARARPRATSPAQALRTVDPSLSAEESEALAEGGTIPPSPVEPHSVRARGPADGIGDE